MSIFRPDENEAEFALVGCVFAGALFGNGNRALSEIMSDLSLEAFQNQLCRTAFEILMDLAESGVVIELTAFSVEWFRRFQTVCPYELLVSADLVPSWRNWRYYRDFISEHFRRRQVVLAASEIAEAAKRPDTVLDDMTERLNRTLSDGTSDGELVDGSQLADELRERITELRALDGQLPGMSTGFPSLDRLTLGLRPGELSVVAARPSEGKSAFGASVFANAALKLGEPVLFVSLEMPRTSIALRMVASICGIDYGAIQSGDFQEEAATRVSEFESTLKESELFIMDASELSISQLRVRVHRLVKSRRIKLIVVDYLQKVRGNVKKDHKREEVAEVSEGLKAIAKRDGIHVMALAQVNREGAKDDRAPKIHEIADSDQIQRDADLCLILHRLRKEGSKVPTNATMLYIAKAREGQLGAVKLRFDGRIQRFFDPLTKESSDR